ncbi:MAG: type II toxin-antitoxin system RelE/ParE family toxin [Deltaproteobacteria bacterium]|nr:type II toxin-antitoxin system RelE/ParE family toxin [Deltaproteobacteria bacterium]
MYEIKWTKKAQKQLKRLEKRHQEKLIAMADSLRENPHQGNTMKMKGFDNRHRIKEGQFRVIYSIYKQQLLVEVLKAGFREGIYK